MVLIAVSREAAFRQAQVERPALIILDVALSGRGGLDVLQALKATTTTAGIPIVLLSERETPMRW
jgi:DNA-binding response OmpR family regulator